MQIGILGTGKIAVDHVAAFQSLGHTVVAGCATSSDSPRWRAFQEVASEARFEPDGEALLGAPDVDVIVTCLPWDVTERWLPCLLATQKPVLIEKPMALSSSAARNAMARPQSNLDNKIIGYNRRFYAPVRKLSERLQQGGLKSAEITISEALTRLIKRHGRDVIDHVVVYSSSHTIDTAVYLLGALKPVHVYSYDEKRYPLPFRSLTGLLETEGGVPVTLSINADNPVPIGIRFFFEDRTTWHLSPLERLVVYQGYEIKEPENNVRIRRYLPKPVLNCTVETDLKPGFLEQARAFTTGVGREIAATPAESVELLCLVEKLYAAATA